MKQNTRFSIANNYFFLCVLTLIIVFCIFVFWGFPDSPSPWFDNGINLGLAKTFVQDSVYTLRLGPASYIEQPSLSISTNYPLIGWIILSFKVFGIGLWQAQVVMVFFLAMFLFFGYKLLIQLNCNRWSALAGVALVVTFLPLYGHGLSGGLGEVPGLVYLFSALLLFQKKDSRFVILSGVCFGLAAATKVIYLSILLCLVLSELYAAWCIKKVPWKRWCLLGGGIIVPLGVWVVTMIPRHVALLEYLYQTYQYYHNPYKATGSVWLVNGLKFFSESTPIHCLIAVVSVVSFWRLSWRESFERQRTVIVLLVFMVVNLVWFLETPGWYRYFFPAHVVALLFFPSSLVYFAARLRLRWWGKIVWCIIFSLLIGQGAFAIHNRNAHIYYNPEPRRLAAHLEKYLGADANIFFIDQPEMWFLFPGKGARQYMRMNPYISFGEDFFVTGKYPLFVVTGNHPERNNLLVLHAKEFSSRYTLSEVFGHYNIFYLRRM